MADDGRFFFASLDIPLGNGVRLRLVGPASGASAVGRLPKATGLLPDWGGIPGDDDAGLRYTPRAEAWVLCACRLRERQVPVARAQRH